MTVFLIVVIVVLLIALVLQWAYRRRLVKTSSDLLHSALLANIDLEEKISEEKKNYAALEQGTQEIIDNYENDLLDLKDRNEAAYNSAAYDREKRDEAEKKLSQWDAAIRKHAGHCDTILEEMVDVMMEDFLPKGE